MTSWQIPLAKLTGLLVLLPFTATYLHLYHYAYMKNEYCFVGPHTSSITGKPYQFAYQSSSVLANNNDIIGSVSLLEGGSGIANNEIRGETTIDDGRSASSLLFASTTQFYGIYAPIAAQTKRKKNANDVDKRQFQQKYATIPSSSSSTKSSSSSSSSWIGNFLWGNNGWPSITQSSLWIYSPSSSLSNRNYLHENQDGSRNANHGIHFVENESGRRWCLSSSAAATENGSNEWCSEILPNYPEGTLYVYPPSGMWTSTIPTAQSATTSPPPSSSSSIYVACPTPPTILPTTKKYGIGRHKSQNAKQNKNVQFLLQHPSTTLLMLLNVGLAFHYWNQRINPSSVSKQYSKIVEDGEWWRGMSGATAHFEPLHIGFNMMSLHTLGLELEGGFGSIIFLIYNLALIVFTTMVMMGMVYGRIRYLQYKIDHAANNTNTNPQTQQQLLHYTEMQTKLRNTSSVGYSAVLFAWMVISTMERRGATCPIPFFNDVCFSTYEVPGLPWLKVNLAPMVSLFVAQFIMPRVSFMGHLAGIVCGFFLHWGWILPPLEACSPNVLIGGVVLIGFIWRKKIIPVRPLLTAMMDEEGCVEHEEYLQSVLLDNNGEDGSMDSSNNGETSSSLSTADPFMRSKLKKKERERDEFLRKQKTLFSLRNWIGITFVTSMVVFDWKNSLVASQGILLAYVTFGTQSMFIVWAYTRSKEPSDIIEPEKARSGMIWRGFFLSAILTIVVDSMSMASWMVLPTLITSSNHTSSSSSSLSVGIWPAVAFTIFRMGVNILALITSSKLLHDTSQIGNGGIFVHVFSMAIGWTKRIADHGLFTMARSKPLWTAFEGRGITLGRRR
eukprot:CAMPEP_0183714204 /NCGR_PEP_ID=MMETSP0737-20130205/8818_1 /TAXON_ID=385413 /ORGANISM="Thalassiosira miniscula, Strain CCMP1093" /LENGTH=839 /DNA_ID=CAMNT_0025943111 /DNA_START=45 /DNA_END=2564 /DNA_ORIENTATION=+